MPDTHRIKARRQRVGNLRDRLVARLPAGLRYLTAEWLLALLCAVSGLLFLFAGIDSNSLINVLPAPLYTLWGVMLVVGAFALGGGLTSVTEVKGRYVITRVPIYKLGLRLLGSANLVYALSLALISGTEATVALIGPVAFAAMCGIRLLTVGAKP